MLCRKDETASYHDKMRERHIEKELVLNPIIYYSLKGKVTEQKRWDRVDVCSEYSLHLNCSFESDTLSLLGLSLYHSPNDNGPSDKSSYFSNKNKYLCLMGQ